MVEFGLGVEFGVFAAVGEKRVDVVKEVSVSVGDAARRQDEDSLFGFFWGQGGGGSVVFMTAAFGEGLVDGSH